MFFLPNRRTDRPTVSPALGAPEAVQGPTTPRAGSRRSFLKRSLTTTAVAAPAAILAAARSGQARAPRAPVLPQLYPGWLQRNFEELRNDEQAHVAIIQDKLNGDPDNPFLNNPAYMVMENGVTLNGVRPMPRFVNLVQPSLFDFATTAAAIENTGVGVYIGIIQAILPAQPPFNGEYFDTATGIGTIEGRHTGFLNTLLNMAVVPNDRAIDSAISQEIALDSISPFIPGGADNGLNPPITTFSTTTPSQANDFFILDFLLVLEYLEAAFYTLNYRKFFGG